MSKIKMFHRWIIQTTNLAARLACGSLDLKLCHRWLVYLAGCVLLTPVHGQTDLPSRLPGLVAHYEHSNGSGFDQVSLRFQQSWQSPDELDERLRDSKSTRIVWRGLLDCKAEGKYRLHVFQKGLCSLWLDGQEILEGRSDNPQWHASRSLDLATGFHELKLQYENQFSSGALGLYWQGPGFELEPLNEKYLYHSTTATVANAFERGRLLSRALRCEACHGSNHSPQSLPAPPLTQVAETLNSDWLVAWLSGAPQVDAHRDSSLGQLKDDQVQRRMPHFALQPQDARDIAAALRSFSAQLDRTPLTNKTRTNSSNPGTKSTKSKSKESKPARSQPDAAEGRLVFQTQGCLACHTLQQQGFTLVDPDDETADLPLNRLDTLTQSLFNGGDLSAIGDKRTDEFLRLWLLDPQRVHAVTRMPQPDLTDLQRDDLVLYLTSLGSADKAVKAGESSAPSSPRDNPQRGLVLLAQHRCGACHELPSRLPQDALGAFKKVATLSAGSNWERGCVGTEARPSTLPEFALTANQRQALRAYWSQLNLPAIDSADAARNDAPRPDLLLAEWNCLACHARNSTAGLAPKITRLAATDADLAGKLPALLPPSLTGVGDKYHASALEEAILRRGEPRRPWLELRMPKYTLQRSQTESLVKHFMNADRIPDREYQPSRLPDDVVTRSAAARLVTAEGFGCQSCHQIGKQLPPTVALNARGTDLTMLGKKIRREWFDRWVRNPVRMVPRMEMPAIQMPVHGVLDDDLQRQIDAVWEMLNTEGFQPPTPSAVRIVRAMNRPGVAEPASVLTDVLETPSQNYLRPLIIGLGNRQNVLFDLETGELAQWWLGDTARELTRGKSWYWEIGGQSLGTKGVSLLKWKLIDSAGNLLSPVALEQFATELDGVRHTEAGVVWNGRITFGTPEKPVTVPIEFRLEPWRNLDGSNASGIDCHLSARMPNSLALVAELDSAAAGFQSESTDGGQRIWTTAIDKQSSLRIRASESWKSLSAHAVSGTTVGTNQPTVLHWTLETTWPVDQWFAPSVSNTATPNNPDAVATSTTPHLSQPLRVVPGFEGITLPLPRNEMPVGLAWHRGTLIAASLKGKVVRASDTNGDGLAETWQAISDDFPAPYGLASQGRAIDVLTKVGLLRLTEPEQENGMPWPWQTVADGWGYTADYHDWAVGLPQDAQGNYYVALPCQQDDRSISAARLRGTIQKLIPQTPTSEQPRAYRLETYSAGQRFPMGLAFNSQGDLFSTDNQGNYNPFNELNHLRFGKRYGFINKLENRADFRPDFEPPAINLPHPWTRSVNGICFLQTPASANVPGGFGPYEGHLIGCEYNGLSLIRMSLELVQGQYQGAAYLFSRPPVDGEATFEGPVVCAVSPEGQLFVGNIHDSGWGGGQNTGSIVRLTPTGAWPLGISTVTALADGLRIDFTGAIDPQAASDAANYTIRSYRRISTPAYGGADQDERDEPVLRAEVAADHRRVDLKLKPLRAGCVYEVRVGTIAGSQTLFPSEAHYSMNKLKP